MHGKVVLAGDCIGVRVMAWRDVIRTVASESVYRFCVEKVEGK